MVSTKLRMVAVATIPVLCVQFLGTYAALAQSAPSNQPYNLDLTSSNASTTSNILATHGPQTIVEDGVSKTFSAGANLTPGERLAIYQVYSSANHTQSITLGADGAATGGSLTIGPHFSNYVSGVVIPTGVTAFQDVAQSANLNLTGNLVNSGALFTYSTSQTSNVANISAANITNNVGAQISSVLPTSVLQSLNTSTYATALNLSATQNLTNYGSITSAAALNATAGGTLTNAVNAVMQSAAVMNIAANVVSNAGAMSAVQNLNISSANITNIGQLISSTANINLLASQQNMLVNAVGGSFQAPLGAINIGDLLSTAKFDVNLVGGDFLSQSFNIDSGTGKMNGDIGAASGIINLRASDVHLLTHSPQCNIGSLTITDDPFIVNNLPGTETYIIEAWSGSGGSIDASGPNGQIFGGSISSAGGDVNLKAHLISVGSIDAGTGIIRLTDVGSDSSITTGDLAAGTVMLTLNGVGSTASTGAVAADAVRVSLNGEGSTASTNSVVATSVFLSAKTTQPVVFENVFPDLQLQPNGSISVSNLGTGAVTLSGDYQNLQSFDAFVKGTLNLPAHIKVSPTQSGFGSISIDANTINFSGAALLDANAVLANGRGGDIGVFAVNLNTPGGLTCSANGLGTGGGGDVSIEGNVTSPTSTALNLSANSSIAMNANGGSAGGNGGFLDFEGVDTINLNGSTVVMNANGGATGNGGTVVVQALGNGASLNVAEGSGAIEAHADGGTTSGNGGEIVIDAGGDAIIAGAAATVSVRGSSGSGGTIRIGAGESGPGTLSITGNLNAVGNGGAIAAPSDGGVISLHAPVIVDNGAVSLLTNAGEVGNGGFVTVETTDASIGDIAMDQGGLTAQAEGGTTSGNGGSIQINAKHNLTANASAVDASAAGTIGDGGTIRLVAGFRGNGADQNGQFLLPLGEGDATLTGGNAQVNAGSTQGNGGSVAVHGQNVRVVADTTFSANGHGTGHTQDLTVRAGHSLELNSNLTLTANRDDAGGYAGANNITVTAGDQILLNSGSLVFNNSGGTSQFTGTGNNYLFTPLIAGIGAVVITSHLTTPIPQAYSGWVELHVDTFDASSLTVNAGGTNGANGNMILWLPYHSNSDVTASNITLRSTADSNIESPFYASVILFDGISGKLTLTNATLDVSSAQGFGGNVYLNAHDISVHSSTLLANSGQNGGSVNIAASGSVAIDNSTLRADSTESGNGGSIMLASQGSAGIDALVSVSAKNSGDGGQIFITAGIGDAASELHLAGAFSADGVGSGRGGTINVTAPKIVAAEGSTLTLSAQSNGAAPTSTGGQIDIVSQSDLELGSGAISVSSTGVSGNAGTINVKSEFGKIAAGTSLQANGAANDGSGGIIAITADNGSVTLADPSASEGGGLSVRADGGSQSGNGGSINIAGTGDIELKTSIISSNSGATAGTAGTVSITTPSNLVITSADGSTAVSARGATQQIVNMRSDGGLITLRGDQGIDINGSIDVSTDGTAGDAGHITFKSDTGDIRTHGSLLAKAARGEGGKIDIDPFKVFIEGDVNVDGENGGFFGFFAFDDFIVNGNISANGGINGGLIDVAANGLLTVKGSVTATGGIGIGGTIILKSNGTNPNSEVPFVIGGPGANGVQGTVSIHGSIPGDPFGFTNFAYIEDSGHGGIDVRSSGAINAKNSFGGSGSIVLVAPQGEVKLPALFVNSVTGSPSFPGNNGNLIIKADTIQLGIVLSNNFSAGTGGVIKLAANHIITTGVTTINSSGSNGGAIFLVPTAALNVAVTSPFVLTRVCETSFTAGEYDHTISITGPEKLTINANGTNHGGSIDVHSSTLSFEGSALNFNARSTENGAGGNITVLIGALDMPVATLTINSSGSGEGSGGAASVSFSNPSFNAIIGNEIGGVRLRVNGGLSNTSPSDLINVRIASSGNLNVNAGEIVASAAGSNDGSVIQLIASGTLALTGNLNANSISGKGGRISLTGNDLDLAGPYTIHAHGAMSGGEITLHQNSSTAVLSIPSGTIEARGTGEQAPGGQILLEVASAAVNLGPTSILDVSTSSPNFAGGTIDLLRSHLEGSSDTFSLVNDGTIRANSSYGLGKVFFEDPNSGFHSHGSGLWSANIDVTATSIEILNSNANGVVTIARAVSPDGPVDVFTSGANSIIRLASTSSIIRGSHINLESHVVDLSQGEDIVNAITATSAIGIKTTSTSNGNIYLGSYIHLDGDGLISVSTHGTGDIIQNGAGALSTTPDASTDIKISTEHGSVGASEAVRISGPFLTVSSALTTAVVLEFRATNDQVSIRSSDVGSGQLSLTCGSCIINTIGAIHASSVVLTVEDNGGIVIHDDVIASKFVTLTSGTEAGNVSVSSGLISAPKLEVLALAGQVGSELTPFNVNSKNVTLTSKGSALLHNSAEALYDVKIGEGNFHLISPFGARGSIALAGGTSFARLETFSLGSSAASRMSIKATQFTFDATGNVFLATTGDSSLLGSRAASVNIVVVDGHLTIGPAITLRAFDGNLNLSVAGGFLTINAVLSASHNISVFSGDSSLTGTQKIAPGSYPVGIGQVLVTGPKVFAPANFDGINFNGTNTLNSSDFGRILLKPGSFELNNAEFRAGSLSSQPQNESGPTEDTEHLRPVSYVPKESTMHVVAGGMQADFVNASQEKFSLAERNLSLISRFGSFSIRKGTRYLVDSSGKRAVLINLGDQSRGSVSFQSEEGVYIINPGEALVVTDQDVPETSIKYASRNHRKIHEHKQIVSLIEVSIPDVLVTNSDVKWAAAADRKLYNQILKLTACLTLVKRGHESYRRN